MEKFSSYAFNKAHSASYANMAYQAVYLKTHHTVPYLAAVLNAGGGYYGLEEYVEEAKRQGIRILGPDANRSGQGFEVEDGAIRVGFTSIKGLATKTVGKILEERTEGGEFGSVEDFLERVSLSKSELLALIRAGVFDSLEPRRTRQVLRYFQGLEDMEQVADIDDGEKARMLIDSLGFSPGGRPARPLRREAAAAPDPGPQEPCGQPGRARGACRGRPADSAQRGEPVFLPVRGRDGAPRGCGGDEMPEFRHAADLLPERRGPKRRQGPVKILNCTFLRAF